MRKLTAIVLAALLLVPLLAGPAQAWGRGGGWRGGGGWHGGGGGCCWGGFALGLGIGALATAPFWYPPAYAYPAYPYAYPTYPYPAYSYPAYAPPVYAPPTDPGAGGQADPSTGLSYGSPPANPPQPSAQGSAPSGGQNCETVTVQAHYETRTAQDGQRVTAWIPAYSQQVCQ